MFRTKRIPLPLEGCLLDSLFTHVHSVTVCSSLFTPKYSKGLDVLSGENGRAHFLVARGFSTWRAQLGHGKNGFVLFRRIYPAHPKGLENTWASIGEPVHGTSTCHTWLVTSCYMKTLCPKNLTVDWTTLPTRALGQILLAQILDWLLLLLSLNHESQMPNSVVRRHPKGMELDFSGWSRVSCPGGQCPTELRSNITGNVELLIAHNIDTIPGIIMEVEFTAGVVFGFGHPLSLRGSCHPRNHDHSDPSRDCASKFDGLQEFEKDLVCLPASGHTRQISFSKGTRSVSTSSGMEITWFCGKWARKEDHEIL